MFMDVNFTEELIAQLTIVWLVAAMAMTYMFDL